MTEQQALDRLRQYAADPLAFIGALRISSAAGVQSYSKIGAEFQWRDFRALAPALKALAKGKKPEPHSRFWLERTKGASKDTDIAACLLWLVAFSPRALVIQIGARDAGQADELRKAILDIVRNNPWLETAQKVRVLRDAVVKDATGTRADILTSDAPGAHGSRPDVVIPNELTHVDREEFPLTLADNASKMPNGILIVATNAGYSDTWQERWRDNARESDRWHFSAYAQPAPWLDPAELADAKRRNPPLRFQRLYWGEWGVNGETALNPDDIDAAITLTAPLSQPEKGYLYAAGLDLSLTRDASAFVVVGLDVGWTEEDEAAAAPASQRRTGVHAILDDLDLWPESQNVLAIDNSDLPQYTVHGGTGRLKLVCCHLWRPRGNGQRLSLRAIEEGIIQANERFGIDYVLADLYQAARVLESLQDAGLAAEGVQFTGPILRNICSTTLEPFSQRRIDLYPEPALLADLRALKVVEKSYGVKLESPYQYGEIVEGTPHGDASTALGLALVAATKLIGTPPARVQGPLICWPQ